MPCQYLEFGGRKVSGLPHEAMPSEMAKQGDGTTILSLAVRMRAPATVIQCLVEAETSQLSVVHKMRGSILQDGLGQGLLKTVKYLLQAVKEHGFDKILSETDDLGRTALHCLVLHAMRANHCPGTTGPFSVNWFCHTP